jgi:hypothetical protein
MTGDVENWRTGGPGDHGLETSKLCDLGEPTSHIVFKAIRQMDIASIPEKTHYSCRHKRWGASYELLFEIAAIIALRNENNIIKIWNHSYHTRHKILELDKNADMKEHPGAFIFSVDWGAKSFIVAGDGRVLSCQKENLWYRYMHGESAYTLSSEIERYLKSV